MKEERENTNLIKVETSILKKVINQLDITKRITDEITGRLEDNKILEPLIIEGTDSHPSIRFDAIQGILEIKGHWTLNMVSAPMNAVEFYKPLLDLLDQYGKNPTKPTNVLIQFEYLGTCGSHCMIDILRKFEKMHKNKDQVLINWYYKEGDLDMLEVGEDYASIIRAPFNMIPYKTEEDD